MNASKGDNNSVNPSAPVGEEARKKEIIENNLLKIKPGVSEKDKQKITSALLTMYGKGVPLGDAMGFSEGDLHQIYRFAYSEFYAGQYAVACELFKVLFHLRPSLNELATAIGVCHHRMGEYRLAISSYMLAGAMTPEDPVPYFYAYDCYKNLNRPFQTFIMLSTVIEKCKDRPEYAKLKEKAQILLDSVNKDLASLKPEETGKL